MLLDGKPVPLGGLRLRPRVPPAAGGEGLLGLRQCSTRQERLGVIENNAAGTHAGPLCGGPEQADLTRKPLFSLFCALLRLRGLPKRMVMHVSTMTNARPGGVPHGKQNDGDDKPR